MTDDPRTPDLDRFHDFLAYATRVRGGTVEPTFRADGSRFVFAEGGPDRTQFLEVDPVKGSVEPLFDVDRLRKAIESHLRHAVAYDGVPFSRLEFVRDETAVRFEVAGRQLDLDLDTYEVGDVGAVEQLTAHRLRPRRVREGFMAKDPGQLEVLSPDKRLALGHKDHDLWLRSVLDDRGEALTDDGQPDLAWRASGSLWAPEGLRVTAVKVDTRHVARLPVVHWLKPTEEVEQFPYTKAGGALPHNELYVVDVLSRQRVRIETGEDPESFLFPVAWLPDGSELLYATLGRTYRPLRLHRADVATGESRMIVEEDPGTFVLGIRNHAYFPGSATLLGDGQRFVWVSERDGWRHLYLYSLEGQELARLTEGEFEVEQVVGIDEKAGVVFFTAHADPDRPYDVHVCRVGLDGSGFRRLTTDPGMHAPTLVPTRTHLLDTHSSLDRPPRTDLLDAGDGTLVRTLSEADTSELDDLGFEPGEEFTITAVDGQTTLWGVLYRPPGFDPSQRYPVIEYIYGGPQRPEHQSDFAGSGKGALARALSQLGFVVYTVDGRGTPERGKAFQDVVHGRFGEFHVEEHAHAFGQIAARFDFLDPDRVGVVGGSWGGYNTIRSLLLAPEVYKVGVSIAPVGDLYDHAAAAIEGYMGRPQDNRGAYDLASSLSIIDRLDGRLLLIHGTSDVNATLSASMKILDACIRNDKPIDFLAVPEQPHTFEGHAGRYMLDATARYFTEHLR
ncbi:MAG TPA: DPP IV N-terminal domain-containing protein [Nitriliruptorales bacterium]